MSEIIWKKKAIKQLKKIKEHETRVTIVQAVSILIDFPNCSNVKKLKNKDGYRLRVGNWRVFFTASLEILYIEEIKKREEKTYK